LWQYEFETNLWYFMAGSSSSPLGKHYTAPSLPYLSSNPSSVSLGGMAGVLHVQAEEGMYVFGGRGYSSFSPFSTSGGMTEMRLSILGGSFFLFNIF